MITTKTNLAKNEGWDILEFGHIEDVDDGRFSKLHCGVAHCKNSIEVCDECYWPGEVNYVLWGLLSNWCGDIYGIPWDVWVLGHRTIFRRGRAGPRLVFSAIGREYARTRSLCWMYWNPKYNFLQVVPMWKRSEFYARVSYDDMFDAARLECPLCDLGKKEYKGPLTAFFGGVTVMVGPREKPVPPVLRVENNGRVTNLHK